MEKGIDRTNGEFPYQPQINSERMRTLYRLKKETGKPMTVLLDQALEDLARSFGVQSPLSEGSFLRNADQETWNAICEYRKFLDDLVYQRCLGELEKIKRNG